MTEKITHLTKEQTDRFDEFVDKWTKIGLCKDKANRKEAEHGIRLAYKIAKLHPPEEIIWAESPYAMGVARAKMQYPKVDPESAEFSKLVKQSISGSCYGQHDASWLAFYDYFRIVFGLVEETKDLEGLSIVAQNAGWWIPCKGICFVSERHSDLRLDEEGRIHNADGPAILYPDGWAVYAVHGVRIPDWIIEHPEQITTGKIEKESNAEVRRVMLDKFGWDKYIIQSGAKKIHEDEFGELYHQAIPDDEPLVMVKVLDSTPKYEGLGKNLFPEEERKNGIAQLQKKKPKAFASYFLRVPSTMKTAKEAVAWTFDQDPAKFQVEKET